IASSAAALTISGLEPGPRPSVTCRPIWMMRSAREDVSAWASVLATTKSTPTSPETIMLLTALPPAPPTPHTMMRGFSSRSSGALISIVMSASLPLAPAGAPLVSVIPKAAAATRQPGSSSKTLLQPAPDPCDVSVVGRVVADRAVLRPQMFEARRLRIDHQPDGGGEGRAFRRLRQPFDAERATHARLRRDDGAGDIGKAAELARAARQ